MGARKRPGRGVRVSAIVLLAVMAGSRPSSKAAEGDFQLVSSVSAGATDNAQVAAGMMVEEGDPDVFTMLRAGIIGLYPISGHLQRFSYNFNANLYYELTQANAYNHQAMWLGSFGLRSDLDLVLSVDLNQGRLNAIQPVGPPSPGGPPATGGGAPLATPVDPMYFFSAGFREGLIYYRTPGLQWTQQLTVRAFYPLNMAADTFGVEHQFGVHRLWAHSSGEIRARLGYMRMGDYNVEDILLPLDDSYGELMAIYHRRLSDHFSGSAGLGGLGIFNVNIPRAIVGPAARAGLAYHYNQFGASTELSHSVQANIFLGDTLIMDTAALTLSYSFGLRQQLQTFTGGSYQYGRRLSPAVVVDGSVTVWNVHAGMGYRLADSLRGALTYTFQDQDADVPADSRLMSFRRNVVMLTVEGAWPPHLPQRMGRHGARLSAGH